jgi:putative acetyltransferase
MPVVTVTAEPPRQPEVLELLRQGDEFTLALYPPESSHLLSVDELERPGVTVFVARTAGNAVGMVALVADGGGVAELKRMFVLPAARGTGTGAALLAALSRTRGSTGSRWFNSKPGPCSQPPSVCMSAAGTCSSRISANTGVTPTVSATRKR